MTMRLGGGTKASIRFRAKDWCECVEIVRLDGTAHRFTSHDQTVTVEGLDYVPAGAPSASNERRQEGLSDQSQEMIGPVSSSAIAEADLNVGAFDGAQVTVSIVNWRWPWRVYYRQRKFVSSATRDANGWKFELVGLTQKFAQPAGGRFGGYFAPTCPYTLFASGTCKAVAADGQTGRTVATVTGDTYQFTADAGWSSGYPDDWYRDGEVTWTTGDNAGIVSPIAGYEDGTKTITLLIPTPNAITVGDGFSVAVGCDGLKDSCLRKFFATIDTSGTSTGSNSGTTLNDTGKTWTTNAYQGLRVLIVRGTGSGQSAVIASNSATQLVVATSWTTTPDATSVYRVGTPNVLNFGGSPYDPGSGPALELPR